MGVLGIVPAAGSGRRFGAAEPKQLLMAAGRPVLAWSVGKLLAAGCDEVVVAVPAGREEEIGRLVGEPDRVRCVAGGVTRQESVWLALSAAAGDGGDLVVVHDGARPAVAVGDVRAVIAAAREADGAILGRPLDDTLKRAEDGRIVATMPREGLFRAETPQVFHRDVLVRAHVAARRSGREATDEAGLVELLGGTTVRAVRAGHPNPKLTHPSDLPLVELLLRGGA